jgi:hypothetical protein
MILKLTDLNIFLEFGRVVYSWSQIFDIQNLCTKSNKLLFLKNITLSQVYKI